jgi:hypothetical protein
MRVDAGGRAEGAKEGSLRANKRRRRSKGEEQMA